MGLLVCSGSIQAQDESETIDSTNSKTASISAADSSQSLSRDHRAFVDGLIADELRPSVNDTPPAATVVQDSTLLGKSEQPAPTFEPSVHFVGVSQMGDKPRMAELYYRGTTSLYAVNARVPTGQKIKSISHTSVTLTEKPVATKDNSDGQDGSKKESVKEVQIILPLTSIKEAQQERQRFKEGATFYKSLGLGQY